MESKMAQRIDNLLVKLAIKISQLLNWFSIRLDYYVEVKQWETSQHGLSEEFMKALTKDEEE
jgi:hypothetical protein